MSNKFESRLAIGDEVVYQEDINTRVVAVKFTESKVLYSLLDIDRAVVLSDVDSCDVEPQPSHIKGEIINAKCW